MINLTKKLALTLFFFTLSANSTERKALRIVGQDNGEFVLMPYTAPIMYVKQLTGPRIPASGSLVCKWINVKTGQNKGVFGYCESGVIVRLTGMDLNQ